MRRPWGGEPQLLTEQSDKTGCCPSPVSVSSQGFSFNVLDRRGLALAVRFKCRRLQSLRVGFLYVHLSFPKVSILTISLISSSFSHKF